MKLLVLFLSLVQSYLFKDYKKDVNMNVKYEEVESIDTKYNNFTVKEKVNLVEVYFESELVEIFNDPVSIKFFTDSKYFYILYKENYISTIKLTIYDFKGNIYKKAIIDNMFIGKMDASFEKDSFTIITTVNECKDEYLKNKKLEKPYLKENDCLIFSYNIKIAKITNALILGGELNESFDKLYKHDLTYYIVGSKDEMSGHDFGNGGIDGKGYILLKINKDLTTFYHLTFSKPIKNIEFKDKIYIFTESDEFTFDYRLNQEIGLKFPSESIFGMASFNYKVGIFYRDNLKIYSSKENLLLDEVSYPFKDLVNEVTLKNDKLYLITDDKIYNTIFYDEGNTDFTFIYDNFSFDNVKKEILAFPSNLHLKEIRYEEGYDSSIFGTFNIYLDYEGVLIPRKVKILERSNITDGYIYPTGYKLFFSGKGYLNGNEILNNYIVDKVGEYELKLVGKDETIIKHFKILDMDINYQEQQTKTWDYEVYTNEALKVEIDLDLPKDANITKVSTNLEDLAFDFKKDTNTLILTISKNIPGLYKYLIKNIEYTRNNINYQKEINKEIILKVISEKINLETFVTNDDKNLIIDFKFLNNNDLVRFLKIKTHNTSEQSIYLPIKSGKIDISGITCEDGLVNSSMYLVYDNGRKYYEEEVLFDFDYDFNDLEFGEMVVNLNEDDLENIILKLNISKSLKKLNINGEEINLIKNKANYLPLIITPIIIILIFITIKAIKINKRKRNLNL